jgi:hypothetical protein
MSDNSDNIDNTNNSDNTNDIFQETQQESQQESQANSEQLATFNKKFEAEKLRTKNQSKNKEKELNDKLKSIVPYTPIYSQNLWSILINLKNAWFDILDDLLKGNFSWQIFTKDSRLFYIGLTFCIISIILFLLEYITNDEEENKKNSIMEVRHIYEYINAPPTTIQNVQPAIPTNITTNIPNNLPTIPIQPIISSK